MATQHAALNAAIQNAVPVPILETQTSVVQNAVLVPIVETQISETRIVELVPIVELLILVPIWETRIWAPIGVPSVALGVRYAVDRARVSHHRQALTVAQLEQALVSPLRVVRASLSQQVQAQRAEQTAEVQTVAVEAFVVVVGRGKYASAEVLHQARRPALVEPRQSDAR